MVHVSFIIPAYNAADTIVRCLDSIYNLPLKRDEFEVIVIDDASSDKTVEIIEQYCMREESLTLLRQSENHRQGAARNRGVKEAKGEYICFVDADDAVTEGIVDAIRSSVKNATDMTAYHLAFVNEMGIITKEAEHLSFPDGQLFTGIELQTRHPYWFSGPVAYVYNRAFLEHVNYPFVEGVLFEDSDFVAVHLYHAKRMIYSPALGYKAYYREGSTTRSKTYQNVADYVLLGMRMLRFYESIAESGKWKEEGAEQFAERILEGACFNVTISLKRIYKLHDTNEIRAFYNRLDSMVDRKKLYQDPRMHKYQEYWNLLAIISIKYKHLSILLNSFLMLPYKVFKSNPK